MLPENAPYPSVKSLLDVHIQALQAVAPGLEQPVEAALPAILERLGMGAQIVVSGLGKSFHIGQKIAATLNSTGTPARVLHPTDALHGDLGVFREGDVALLLSYSGESRELLELIPLLKRRNPLLIAITGDVNSRLAKGCDNVLPVPIPREACPFNMAPTTSALVTLAAADALGMMLCQARGFTIEDYAALHPAGAIGNGLFLTSKDIMRHGDRFATCPPEAPIREGVIAMGQARAGSVVIAGPNRKMLGIVTDGDLRRHLLDDGDLTSQPLSSIMTTDPIQISEQASVLEVIRLFELHAIDDVPVVDEDGHIKGVIDLQDLPKVKIL